MHLVLQNRLLFWGLKLNRKVFRVLSLRTKYKKFNISKLAQQMYQRYVEITKY